MAELNAKSLLPSISFGHKRMPSVWGYASIAGVFDALAMIPFVGWLLDACFIGCCVLTWWINDYKIDISGAKIGATLAFKFIPLPIPALILFVVSNYRTNQKETEPAANENVGKQATERGRIASAVNSYASRKAGMATAAGMQDEKSTQEKSGAQNRSVGYEKRGTTGNGVIAPTSTADKNTLYQGKAAAENRSQDIQNRNVGYGARKNNVDGITASRSQNELEGITETKPYPNDLTAETPNDAAHSDLLDAKDPSEGITPEYFNNDYQESA